MGVITGNFPVKGKESLWSNWKKRLIRATGAYISLAENYGLLINDREVALRKN